MSNMQRYWLCCGSTVYPHGEKTCNEARLGHPEHVRYGTAEEHSAWFASCAKRVAAVLGRDWEQIVVDAMRDHFDPKRKAVSNMTKYCKDCHHSRVLVHGWFGVGGTESVCVSPSRPRVGMELVDGILREDCFSTRIRNSSCGPEGKYWEPKE